MGEAEVTEVLKAERPAELDAAIDIAAEITGWERDEIVNVMSNITAKTPDDLMDHIGEILQWCEDVEKKAAVVDLMKRLPAGILWIEWDGTAPVLGFRPGLDIQVDEERATYVITEPGK